MHSINGMVVKIKLIHLRTTQNGEFLVVWLSHTRKSDTAKKMMSNAEVP